MRHGKSSWENPSLDDFDRPLKKRGEKDSALMSEFLRNQDLMPDVILTSPAQRAISTALKITQKNPQPVIFKIDSFYPGVADYYLMELEKMADTIKRVMIVGHNPALEELIKLVSGRNEVLKTANIAWIELQIKSWKDVMFSSYTGKMLALWRPKEIIIKKKSEK